MRRVQLIRKLAACNSSAVDYVNVSRHYSVDDRTVNKYGTVGGLIIGRGNKIARRKSTAVLLYTPQIPYELNEDRTRAVTVGSW
jgi:hypothetical protein